MSTSGLGPIGIAQTTLISASVGAGNEKQVAIEKLGSRHTLTSFDFEQGKKLWHKVKANNTHQGVKLVALGIKPDAWIGTEHERFTEVLVLSEHQEVWAANGRGQPAIWVAAKDLVPNQHVFPLGYAHEGGAWSALAWAKPPTWEKYQDAPVHELVLVGGNSYQISSILLRTSSVAEPPPVKKRLVYPLKDVPVINFVPQPKTLSLAQAEIWYRKSSALLPLAVSSVEPGPDQVQAMWALKHRLRDVAVKSAIETSLRHEFVSKHPIPDWPELLPGHEAMPPEALASQVEAALRLLASPGDRRYSEFCGGMESHRVRSEAGYWEFDGTQWVLTTKEG
jgi:hypothetical protein